MTGKDRRVRRERAGSEKTAGRAARRIGKDRRARGAYRQGKPEGPRGGL